MKYKNIRSMAHNWSHSFMSDNNYVDGESVSEDVYNMARAWHGDKVTISWVPPIDDNMPDAKKGVRLCIQAYRDGLGDHLRRHNVDLSALREFRTEVYVAENFRMYVRAYVRDDRGREHISFVWS